MTNYTKILKLLKAEVQEAIDDQPDLDRNDVLYDILEGIKTDFDNEEEEDDDGDEGYID
jgi:hypothetical protein